MNESESLKEESKRIKWRREILEGKYGDKPLRRLVAMVKYKFTEKLVT